MGTDVASLDQARRSASFRELIEPLDVPGTLRQCNGWVHAMSVCFSYILPAADKLGFQATQEDIQPLIDIFQRLGALKDVSSEEITQFVTMLLSQFAITKDVGVPLGITLADIAEASQRKEIQRADAQRQIQGILDLVKSRIDALEITAEVRALLMRWFDFHITTLPPLTLDPNEIKRELDGLARSWAGKVMSGEIDGDQESSPIMQEWFGSLNIAEKISPAAQRMDMQFYTLMYEAMQWATTREIPFALKDGIQLAGEFEKILDMSVPGVAHALYMEWAESAFLRGKMVQAVGLALPPFQGIERKMVMAITNESRIPAEQVLGKIGEMGAFIEGKDLSDSAVRGLKQFALQCAQFAAKTLSQFQNPEAFTRTVFEHILTVTRGWMARPGVNKQDIGALEQEVTQSLMSRFGALFTFHQSNIASLLSKEGGTSLEEGASAEDIAKSCFQAFARKNKLIV